MYKLFFFFIFCMLAYSALYAQNSKIGKQLDDLLKNEFKPSQPGCEVLIAKHGTVIYKKAFGSADMQLNVALNSDMVFNIGSITKQFTAVAILQLVERERISLQDSLQKFIPGYPSKGYTITIENLLTHTSGIRDYLQNDYAGLFMERWDFTPKQLIDSFKNRALEFEPGTQFTYSNSGYYLLGYIIEKVSGKSYQSYIQENLLKPLGLTHTYFDTAGIIIPDRVSGYDKKEDEFKNIEYWSPTIEYAAGGLISNVNDLFQWHQGLYAYKILKKETLQKAFTSYRLKNGMLTGYGYGWFLRNSGGVNSIEHQGGLPGFLADEIYFPVEDIFIATLYNSRSVPLDELSAAISAIALAKILQADVKINEKLLDEYAGVYRLTTDNGRMITIIRQNDHLIASVSETETIPLLFQTETKFQFKNLLDADCEFERVNGKVTKFNVNQNGHFEWIKVQ